MNILVLNAGSSSLKYSYFSCGKEIHSHLVEKIGEKGSRIKNHKQAFWFMMNDLKKHISLSSLDAIGHRIVHGGGKYYLPTLLNQKVLKQLHHFDELAPLHNPYNLLGVQLCLQHFSCPHIGVFDTGFHHELPEFAHTYAIPYSFTKKYALRRYGFHGISHEYVALQAAHHLGKEIRQLKLITCHLGNGASLAAIKDGKSIDTSMGFTPLEGLVMGTRCGDIDSALIDYLMRKEKISRQQIFELLEHQSGLKGLSGYNDMRQIIKRMQRGDKQCALAFHVFCYRIIKYVGAYVAALNGVDALVFTAGIGEHNPTVRHEVLSHLSFLGVHVDGKKNAHNSLIISTSSSKISVFVIPTNEALMIARKVEEKLGKNKKLNTY